MPSSHIQKQVMMQLKQKDARQHVATADKTTDLAMNTKSTADFALPKKYQEA